MSFIEHFFRDKIFLFEEFSSIFLDWDHFLILMQTFLERVLGLRTYPASESRTRLPLTCFPTGCTLNTLLMDSVVIWPAGFVHRTQQSTFEIWETKETQSWNYLVIVTTFSFNKVGVSISREWEQDSFSWRWSQALDISPLAWRWPGQLRLFLLYGS